jgi:hypothetical protein
MQNIIKTRKSTALRPVRFAKDVDGKAIALVTLKGGDVAKLFAEDYAELRQADISPNWFLRGNGTGRDYVSVQAPAYFGRNNIAQVARLLAKPPFPGLLIRYADGDRLNLRRDNLVVCRGKTNAKGRERWELWEDEFALARAV